MYDIRLWIIVGLLDNQSTLIASGLLLLLMYTVKLNWSFNLYNEGLFLLLISLFIHICMAICSVCVCVCACMCACMCARVCVCVYVHMHVSVCMCVMSVDAYKNCADCVATSKASY